MQFNTGTVVISAVYWDRVQAGAVFTSMASVKRRHAGAITTVKDGMRDFVHWEQPWKLFRACLILKTLKSSYRFTVNCRLMLQSCGAIRTVAGAGDSSKIGLKH